HPTENALMCFSVDQPSCARDRNVIRCPLVEPNRKELPQSKRIGQPPCDAAFAIESFEEPNHHDAKILAGRQGWASQFVVIEARAASFAEGVELGVVENFVEPLVEGVTGRCGQIATVPKSRCLSRIFRVPSQ